MRIPFAQIVVAALTWIAITTLTAIAQPVVDSIVTPHPVPPEFTAGRHERYTVTVNGQPVMIFHAALNIYFVSFDFTGQAEVKVVAKDDEYWKGMAVVRPISSGIVPRTDNQTASFIVRQPGQFSVERPGIGKFDDEVLFVFANAPEINVPTATDANVIWLGPGIHRQDVDIASGQTLYLAPGAVLFGGINVWDAENVSIRGRGSVVYYGPQSTDFDSGWVHARNWHPLTTHAVRGLTVEGVTFIGRSRTWTIQTWMTTDANFENIKTIGTNPANVNNDGIDWYGGGQAIVRNCFFRTSDDCFAFLSPISTKIEYRSDTPPWDPGAPAAPLENAGVVSNILIEHCVLWPSRANIIRAGMRTTPALETHHITIRDCDLIHQERRIWLAPDALFCAVTTDGQGDATQHDYLFENIRFEEPMAVLGINVPLARYRNFQFKHIYFTAGIATGLLRANVEGMSFEDVRVGDRLATNTADLNLTVEGPANNIRFLPVAK